MTHFVNIAAPGKPAQIIDIDDLLAVRDDGKMLTLTSQTQGAFLHLSPENGAAARIAALMEAAGIATFAFPARWPNSQTGGTDATFYTVRADAFSYAAASLFAPNRQTGDEQCAMLLGVEGLGRLESCALTRAEEAAILSAIHAAQPVLHRVDPDQAYTHFGHTGFGYALYDPAKLDGVQSNGFQADLMFGRQNWLTFLHPPVEDDLVIDTLRARNPLIGDIDILRQFNRARGEICTALTNDFARAAAVDAPQLAEIEGAKLPFFIRPDRIGSFFIHESGKDMTLYTRKQPGQNYPDSTAICFDTPQALQNALAKITAPAP